MSNYKEDRPKNNYSYSILSETTNFTCEHQCTCDNERSQYDINMIKKYTALHSNPPPHSTLQHDLPHSDKY